MKPPTFLVMAALAVSCMHSSSSVRGDGGARSSAAVEWTAYAHDAQGSRYSPAAQITRANVARLKVAWTYRTGDFARGEAAGRDETTPLMVDGVLYASTVFGGVRALEPETGNELWSFDSELDLSGRYGDFTNRGVSTWLDVSRAAGAACRRRIYVATVDARLIALDARTGEPCDDFGDRGQVRLDRGLTNAPNYKGEYSMTSPPAIVNGLVIVGSTVGDGGRAAAPDGVVRAFSARTGALVWSWDPVPRDSADAAYGTWEGPMAHRTGAANAWSVFSVDSARDMVFVPTGSASPDFFGGERLGENLYANSVVALRASTGKVVWHFQAVHHDLWDYDVPAQPVLFAMHRDGQDIPALVQATKMGHLFVLNRETGEPLFPVEERPVPSSDVPGERAWPTQPFPTLPKPLVPESFDPNTVFALTDSSRAWCRAQLNGARSEGIFTPPAVRGTVIYPGNIGGSNWGGVAIDPARHLAIVPSNNVITLVHLIARADVQAARMGGTRFNEYAPQAGTAYAMGRTHLIAPDGVPCNPPPWGTLTAVNLESGAVAWTRPFGTIASIASVKGSADWGSPNLGGSMVTAGGVVFAGGAVDQRLHAFDVETGKELWSAQLPAGVHASPMTYTARNGVQYVVVAAGGHRELGDKLGDYVVAFSLAGGAPAASSVAPGHYDGHIVLDRTRTGMSWDLTIKGSVVDVKLQTTEPHVEGHGTGRVRKDHIELDVAWTYAAAHCSGTMKLSGNVANANRALIGELDYVDGCTGGQTKPGTFAMWQPPHSEQRANSVNRH